MFTLLRDIFVSSSRFCRMWCGCCNWNNRSTILKKCPGFHSHIYNLLYYEAFQMRLTPCVDVPSFFSPSRGSRSAESLWRNWIACFSLLCCLRAAASSTPESPRFSVRIPVNMLAGISSKTDPTFILVSTCLHETVSESKGITYDALRRKRPHQERTDVVKSERLELQLLVTTFTIKSRKWNVLVILF